MTLDGTMQLLNPTLASLIGGSVEALRGTSLLSTLDGDQRIDLARRMADIFRGERDLDEVEALITRGRRVRGVRPCDDLPLPGPGRFTPDDRPRRGHHRDPGRRRPPRAPRRPRPADRARQPGAPDGSTAAIEKAAADGRPGRPRCSSTSTGSRSSTTASATTPATSCCVEVADRLAAAVAPATPWPASAATSSPCSCTRHGDESLAPGRRLRRSVAEPVELRRGTLPPDASASACADRRRPSRRRLLRDADAAMYRAKERGRNRVEFFDARRASRAPAGSPTRRRSAGRSSDDELRVHYQPSSARDGTIVGHRGAGPLAAPDPGLIPPAEFIARGRGNRLIVPIGEWVLRRRVAQAARVARSRRRPAAGRGQRLGPTAGTPDLVGAVAAALDRARRRARPLWLEITETRS